MTIYLKTFAVLATLFCVGSTSAQQEMEILKEASRLYDANYYMEFDPIPDLTYPAVVENLGGKQLFLRKLDADFQNDKFRKRLQLTAPVFEVNPVKTIGERKFCVISFRNPTRYFFEQKLSNTEMDKEIEQLKVFAETKEVYAEPNRNSINVKRVSHFVGVMDGTTDGKWKFFNLDDLDQLAQFGKIFPSEKSKLGL